MLDRLCFIALSIGVLSNFANAQTPSTAVIAEIKSRNYHGAILQLESIPKDQQSIETLHVLSLLQFAVRDVVGAEKTCERLTMIAPQASPRISGIEPYTSAGSDLASLLNGLKPIISIQCFGATFWNNLGVARILETRYGDATECLDKASIYQLDWGVPWINGSYVALKRGRIHQAESSARQGMALGENGSRAHAILAEALIEKNDYLLAERTLQDARIANPNDPYVALVQAKLFDLSARSLSAERSRIQALLDGKPILVDSRLNSQNKQFGATIGARNDIHASGATDLYNNTIASRIFFAGGEDSLGNSSQSFQRIANLSGAVSGTFGTVSVEGSHFDGTRDTLPTGVITSLPQPDSRLRFDRLNLHWERQSGPILTHVGYRTADVNINSTLGAPTQNELDQNQWTVEAQYRKEAWQIGSAVTRVNRNATGTPAVEPADEVFGNGHTDVSTTYAIRRDKLSTNIRTAVGGVVSGNDGTYLVQLLGASQIRLLGNETINLGIKPRIRTTSSMLYPADLAPEPVQLNQMDRTIDASMNLNLDPTIQSAKGSGVDYVGQFVGIDIRTVKLDTSGFYRLFENSYFQGLSPSSAPPMLLGPFAFIHPLVVNAQFGRTPVASGTTLGVTQHLWVQLTECVSLNLEATLQSTSATYALPTFGTLPGPVGPQPIAESRAPMMPNLDSAVDLSWALPTGLFELDLRSIGDRVQAVTAAPTGSPSATYISKLATTTSANLFYSGRIDDGHSWIVGIMNLGRASFYGGTPTGTSLIFAFASRY